MRKDENKQLNDNRIKGYVAPKSRETVPDHLVKGLVVRFYPSGTKSFVLRYRWNDTVQDYTIGRYPDISLSKAREKAQQLKQGIRDGINPMVEKNRKKKDPEIFTVNELAEDFRKNYLTTKKKSTQASYNSRINKIVAKFGRFSIDDISGRDIKLWLKKEALNHPVNANRLHSIMSKMFSYANEPDQGFTKNHPLKGVDKVAKERSKTLQYSYDDIQALWQAFEEESEPMQSLLKMLLITGQRLGETSRMMWNHIDSDNARWVIPDVETKSDKNHIVPLTQMSIDILENIYTLTGKQPYVFSSPRVVGSHLKHINGAIKRIRQRTGFDYFVVHDLRHIVITGMISLKIDMVHVGKTVSHKGLGKESVITTRYIHYEYIDEKRAALQKWNNHLAQIIRGETNTKFFKLA